ncbi:MAG TPA: FxsA family protein [Thiopseudomonas sp.]|nr:FxsA family protein [Thiopseudomonas sp.]
MRGLFLLFLVFPLLELFLLIRVGSSIGALATLLLVLGSGAVGILCIRLAGLTTALSVRQRMAQGEVPTGAMLNGLLLAIGGVLLFIPGFISDFLGLVCLLPMTRHWLSKRVNVHMQQGATRSQQFYSQGTTYTEQEHPSQSRQPHIIEGEFERKDP